MRQVIPLVCMFVFVSTVVLGLPTVFWSLNSLKQQEYKFLVSDTVGLNNGGAFCKDWIVKQDKLMVSEMTIDNSGNIVLTKYAYHDGVKWIQVSNNPITVQEDEVDIIKIRR